MIQKLQVNGYLKRYDNMSAAELAEYESRVGGWLSADGQSLVKRTGTFEAGLQNVLQASAGWNDQDCRAFEEGAVLLSALVGKADTWLPDMLYAKSAKRAVRLMFKLLSDFNSDNRGVIDKNAAGKPKEEPAEGTGMATQAVGGKSADTFAVEEGGAASVSPDAKPTTVTTAGPVRPKHIDQYVHLLPEKTQERASLVQGLLRELEDARQKMALLMDDKTAKDTDREAWAKKATSIDNRIRKIYDELDSEWDKLVRSGRVVVDDLGNARVMEVAGGKTEDGPAVGDHPSDASPELTSEQKAKRREIRKWLVDTRRGNGDTREEHVRKWQEIFREYLALEGDAAYEDEKIKAAAEHYGIDVGTLNIKH